MRHQLWYISNMNPLKLMIALLFSLGLCSCQTMSHQTVQDKMLKNSKDLLEWYEPRDGVMSLLADAKTGEILALTDLPETGVDRTETYFYDPGLLFNVFRDCAIMFLPEELRDSDKALQYVISQFGFTEYPLVTARQMIRAASVFANHGMMGDVEVVSPKVADITLKSMDKEKPTDMDEYAIVKHKDANAVSALAFYPAEDPQYILYVVALHPAKLK